MTVAALRAGLLKSNGKLLVFDVGLAEQEHGDAKLGKGRWANVKVGAKERDASLGVLLAALDARGGGLAVMWRMLGNDAHVRLALPLLHTEALKALNNRVDAVPADNGRAKNTIAVRGSGHFSNAGRVAGVGKASAPLRFLRYAAKALSLDGKMREVFLKIVGAAREANAASTSCHQPWVALTLSKVATALVAKNTAGDDAAADDGIVNLFFGSIVVDGKV